MCRVPPNILYDKGALALRRCEVNGGTGENLGKASKDCWTGNSINMAN